MSKVTGKGLFEGRRASAFPIRVRADLRAGLREARVLETFVEHGGVEAET
jgi:hypothetical protein